MMLRFRQKSRSGFTLIELAIVLAVVGIMTVGLWRLLSGSNQQAKDSATAGQQVQLINAAKSFLASNDGQAFLESFCSSGCAAGKTVSLPLPLAADSAGIGNCYATGVDTNLSGGGMTMGTPPPASQAYTWCGTLPPGFSAGTTNPYGQTYSIQLMYGTTATSTTAPSAYSIMIMTSGGDTIADTSGGRISSQIGGDGGFIYSTAVCGGSASFACGAYGAWYANPAGTYGFGSGPVPAATSGHVASQTYYSSENLDTGPWLARQFIDSTYNYSTLVANSSTPPSSSIYLNGNAIYSGTHTGVPPLADTSVISLSNTGATGVAPNNSPLTVATVGQVAGVININPAINVQTGCHRSSTTDNTCAWGIQVSGDITVVNGMVNAGVVFTSSDARLKTNIQPIIDPLDDIMRLKPVTFALKSNGIQSLGVIAQDVEKVYPQLVSGGDKDSMRSVNYEGLIAPLIGAVQELKRENDDLRQRLKSEELREKTLEQKLAK